MLTADRGARTIIWVHSKPSIVRPLRDLRLSRQHRVLVQGPIGKRMSGAEEVLIPAKALLLLAGALLDTPTQDITYYHVMLDRHERVCSDNLPTESLFMGATRSTQSRRLGCTKAGSCWISGAPSWGKRLVRGPLRGCS